MAEQVDIHDRRPWGSDSVTSLSVRIALLTQYMSVLVQEFDSFAGISYYGHLSSGFVGD
jgi:hypothetical protein